MQERENVQCLKQPDRRVEDMEEVEKCFNDRKEKESAEAAWKELKEAVVDCAEKHLQRRREPQRQWLSADTTVLVEKKCQKFVQWQEQKCGATTRVSDLVQASEESDKG